ncbi:MAG: SHOCT domain-containing protein [Gaiellaceae bacterium]
MNRNPGPWMNQGPYMEHYGHGGEPHVWAWLFMALVLAALIGLAVFLALRYTSRRAAPPVATAPASSEEALAVLRMRYARGEVSRDEFLQASIDLGGRPSVAEPPPSNPAPS